MISLVLIFEKLVYGLLSLSLKNAGDLSDMGLVAIGRGENVTVKGLRTMVTLLRISCLY